MRPTRYRWFVALLIFLVYTCASADRANIGIALPSIRKEFALSNTEAGAVISMFFLCYAAGQIPAGLLCARLGVRRLFPLAMAATALFTFLIGTAGGALTLKLWRAGLGLGEAALPVTLLASINRWFAPREKGTATGILLAAARTGPVLVPPLGALLIASHGWRALFILFAMPGLLLMVLWMWLVPESPAQSRRVNAAEAALIAAPALPAQGSGRRRFARLDRVMRVRPMARIDSIAGVFASADLWGCAGGYFLLTGLTDVILAWLPSYLAEVKHFSLMRVGFVAAAPFIGAVVGNLLGGVLSDRLLGGRRKPTMMITAAATAAAMLALTRAPDDPLLMALMLFTTGFLLNLGYSSFAVFGMSMTDAKRYPLALGLINTAGQAGGAVAPLIAGMLLDAYDWDVVFEVLAGCSALTLGLLALIREADPAVA